MCYFKESFRHTKAKGKCSPDTCRETTQNADSHILTAGKLAFPFLSCNFLPSMPHRLTVWGHYSVSVPLPGQDGHPYKLYLCARFKCQRFASLHTQRNLLWESFTNSSAEVDDSWWFPNRTAFKLTSSILPFLRSCHCDAPSSFSWRLLVSDFLN